MTMTDAVTEKEAQFERLWAGETPKGVNRTKALKFRQYMKPVSYTHLTLPTKA